MKRNRSLLAEAEKVAHTGAWEWDITANHWSFSDEWLAIHGCHDRQLSGDELLAMAYPEDRATIAQAFQKMQQGLSDYSLEHRLVRRDNGELRWIRAEGHYVRNNAGQVNRVYGFAQDITESKRAEEALRRNEERLKAIFDYAGVGLVEVAEDDRFIAVNDRVCEILGRSREQLLTMNVHELTWPEDRPLSDRLNQELHERKRSRIDYEKRYIRADGSPMWVHLTVSPVYDAQGRWIRSIGTVEDISERKRAEEALRESEERFRTLADNMSQLAWMTDANGLIIWFNKRWYEYTGTTLDEMQGWGWKNVHHPEHSPRVLRKWRAHVSTGEIWEDTFPLRGSDGHYRWFLSRAVPIRAPNGGVKHWFGTNTDITEFRQAQEHLRRAEEEVRHHAENLEKIVQDRTARLRDTIGELEHFSYTITHDMRAPLRAMQAFGQILSEEYSGALDHSGRDFLRRIIESAKRMDHLITDALNYSKVVQTELPLEPIDPMPLLAGMIESYPQFQAPHAEIEIKGVLPKVIGNAAGLTQCFSNLLGNAVKFVERGKTPRVRVWAEERDGTVRFWFEDNGIGIPAEQQDRVFAMFHRLSKDYEGTGIGLALVRKVIERMRGRVGFESQEGQGSRFWIQLQRAA